MTRWRDISTAPRCVASTPGNNGVRRVLVTRYPFNGAAAPTMIAMLTSDGWRRDGGGKLRYVPTHWRPLPPDPGQDRLFTRSFRLLAWCNRLASALRSRDPEQERGTCQPVQSGKVRLHPLPEGASASLASVIGAAVAGAVRDCTNQHFARMSRADRGLLIGSVRKRAVNQLVCDEGEARLREALEYRP